jgi:amino acid transporter
MPTQEPPPASTDAVTTSSTETDLVESGVAASTVHEPDGDEADIALRRGSLTTWNLVVMVAGVQVPLGTVVALTPVAIGFGSGVGTPGTWLIGGLILLAFAVGWSRMSRFITNSGAFYAYISRALGVPLGVAGAIIAVIAYNALSLAATGILASFARTVIGQVFGVDLPWPVYALVTVLVILAIAYRGVDLSVRILSIAVALELVMLLGLVVAVLVNAGVGAFTLEVFAPSHVLDAGAGLTIAIAIWVSLGFESAAVYGEEAKTPRVSVPRASYLSIILITLLYVVVAWAIIAAVGPATVQAQAAGNPAEMVFVLYQQYFGEGVATFVELWSVLSILAACVACHNLAARYMFVLGREGIAARALGRTRHENGAPWNASLAQVCVLVSVLAVVALTRTDPYLALGSGLIGLSVIGVVTLMAVSSVAVLVFFKTEQRGSFVTTVLLPIVSFVGLVFVIAMVLTNYGSLSGYSSGLMTWLPAAIPLAGGLTVVWVLRLRRRQPERYAAIGSQLDRAAELGEVRTTS